jgi:glycosyltransferase involved in cell wall biosynthesis
MTADAVQDDPGARASTSVAVLIPCFNEQATIAKVVRDFQVALPDATVYVYDNASEDRTAEAARTAGAVVRREPVRGKGNVVRRMFADVEADVYVLIDGDDTYDAGAAPAMVRRLLDDDLDMVAGARAAADGSAFRTGHRHGNRLLSGIVGALFGSRLKDMLTGYRVLSRRLVKSFPALTTGFEIETELTVHALELRMPVAEVAVGYRERPKGSDSKLRTVRDGLRILGTIAVLLKEERPRGFFGSIFGVLAVVAIVLAWPLLPTYLETGKVPRFPTAILASATMLLAFLSLAAGMILDTVTRGRRELKRMHYLAIPSPATLAERRPE